MTTDEVKRLHDCWEKPEFKAMFHEYAEEVSDPKHRAEQEAYLAQCEREQRISPALAHFSFDFLAYAEFLIDQLP